LAIHSQMRELCVRWSVVIVVGDIKTRVKELGSAVFLRSLVQTITSLEGVVAIGEACFADCQSLQEASLRATHSKISSKMR
jgi:hypothetical protein